MLQQDNHVDVAMFTAVYGDNEPNSTNVSWFSFTIEVWINPERQDYDASLPIVCSPDGHLCLTLNRSG